MSLSPLIILPLIVKKEGDGPVCLAYLGFGECEGHSAPCHHDYNVQLLGNMHKLFSQFSYL
jgi:hypothetical protein